jgi:hypothetical protein
MDPVHYAGSVDPDSVMIVDAERDRCMREDSREALADAFGRPRRLTVRYGHKNSFLAMTPLAASYLCDEIFEFLDRTLGS